MESINIGLFYTALSRATTIGTSDENRTNSSIFFSQSLDKSRLDRLTTAQNKKEYEMIKRRKAWVELLYKKKHEEAKETTDKIINDMFEWALTHKFSLDHIETASQMF